MPKPLPVLAAVLVAASPAAAVEVLYPAATVLTSGSGKIGGIEVANLPERIDSRPSAVPSVPEPGTWAMLIAGFGLVGAMVRRRRLRAA